ncbi:TPA: hypothetical protein ROX88_003540 [Bacillus pseudomycoides]|nr:hypothetical protein [Bacillus pseudomycoides]
MILFGERVTRVYEVIYKIIKLSAYDALNRNGDWVYIKNEGVEGWMYFDITLFINLND